MNEDSVHDVLVSENGHAAGTATVAVWCDAKGNPKPNNLTPKQLREVGDMMNRMADDIDNNTRSGAEAEPGGDERGHDPEPMRSPSDYLASDLRNLADRIESSDTVVHDVDHEAHGAETKVERVAFEVEFKDGGWSK